MFDTQVLGRLCFLVQEEVDKVSEGGAPGDLVRPVDNHRPNVMKSSLRECSRWTSLSYQCTLGLSMGNLSRPRRILIGQRERS